MGIPVSMREEPEAPLVSMGDEVGGDEDVASGVRGGGGGGGRGGRGRRLDKR
ncbi:MAG TPA: hypothetical protein VGI39_43655 [Polyangiaceae bacterium]